MLDNLLPEGYNMSEAYEELVKAFWPGALTLLFPVAATTGSAQGGHVRTSKCRCEDAFASDRKGADCDFQGFRWPGPVQMRRRTLANYSSACDARSWR